MVTPNDLTAGMTGAFSSYLPEIMRWTGYAVLAVIIIGGMFAIYFFMQYKYSVLKVVYGKMGEGENERPYIRDVIKTKGKIVTENGVKKLKLLFNKVSLPVQFDYIYPRNILILFQLGKEHFLPGKISYSKEKDAFLAPVDEDIDFWSQLNAQQTALEYAPQGFWAKNGSMVFAMGVITFSLILAGAVIFMTYKYIGGELGGVAAATKDLGAAMQQATIQKFGGQ